MSITYNFKMNCIYNYINYYRSTSPFDLNSMPTYTETNILEETFIDTSANYGKKYYVVFSSVRDSVEKYSKQIKLFTVNGNISLWSDFIENFNDDANIEWTKINSPTIESNHLKLVRSSSQRLEIPYSNSFHFNEGEDVTIRCSLKVTNFSTDRRVLLTTRRDDVNARNWAIYLNPNGITLLVWSGTSSGPVVNKTWDSVYNFDEEFEISLERKDMVWNLYINGNVAGTSYTQTDNYTPYLSSKLTLGSEFNTDNSSDTSRDLDGTIRYLQFIKNQALGDGTSSTPSIL